MDYRIVEIGKMYPDGPFPKELGEWTEAECVCGCRLEGHAYVDYKTSGYKQGSCLTCDEKCKMFEDRDRLGFLVEQMRKERRKKK
jgi:hypothetical protein